MSMKLMARDIQLLRWINEAGLVTIEHIILWMQVSRTTAYLRAKKLATHGYLTHDHVFHGAQGIYRVSKVGAHISGSSLPPLSRIPLPTYRHDLCAIRLGLILSRRFGGQFVPERVLRHEAAENAFGKSGHMPDGILVKEEKQFAIEVELNKKSQRRREAIFKHYLQMMDVEEVWYFCGNAEIHRQMLPYVQQASFIKLFNLEEYIKEKGSLF